MSNKSKLLVGLQFSIFVFFALAGHLFASGYLLVVQFLGAFLGLWGIVAMKIGNFNIQPEVKQSALMVSSGPYKILRNPMYSGLLLFFGVSVFANFSMLRLFIVLLLAVVFIMKIAMEETFLTDKFGQAYIDYKENTFRLLPFLY